MHRLLVLEDEPLIAAMLAEWLHQQHFIVEVLAHTAADALRAAKHAALDGAILDVKVGDGPVYPVARELKRRFIPFVFATGVSTEGIDAEFRHEVIVSKPFEFAILEQKLRTMLAPASATSARGGRHSKDELPIAAAPQAR